MKPTVGRIVHYRNREGICRAAIVAQVIDANETILLVVFGQGTVVWRTVPGIPHEGPLGWHWPEREP